MVKDWPLYVADVGAPLGPSNMRSRTVLPLVAPALNEKLSEVDWPGARSVEEAMMAGICAPELVVAADTNSPSIDEVK